VDHNDAILGALFERYKADPVFFVEHALGHKTWSKQRDILRSVVENERTAVRACHGSSKTFTAAELAVWFLNCFEGSKVITTAPTFTQVAKLLWAEMNKIYTTSRFLLEGECQITNIKTEEADHYAIGFSTDKPARAEGWHAPAILFIFDEAKGIPNWLWDTVEGLLTGGHCRWLVISTTDGVQLGDKFYNVFNREDGAWNRIHITAEESPYVTGEKFRFIDIPDQKHPESFEVKHLKPEDFMIQIATPKYISDCKREWGKDSVLFLTKVKGEIVDIGADTIIKLSEAMKMFENFKDETFGIVGQEEAGCDVARGGSDDTVFYRRKGLRILKQRTIPAKEMPPKAKLVYLANELEEFLDFNKDMQVKIDDTGVGGGLTDIMESRHYNIVPVNFQDGATEPDKYPNAISEMWFQTARIIGEIACPEDERLKMELVNRKSIQGDTRGRRVVESKKEYRARGFASPDKADAFLLTFYNPYGEVEDVTVIDEKEEAPAMGEARMPLELMKIHTRENALKYKELSKKHTYIDDIAREMGIEPRLLKEWVQREGDYINSVKSKTKDADEVIVI